LDRDVRGLIGYAADLTRRPVRRPCSVHSKCLASSGCCWILLLFVRQFIRSLTSALWLRGLPGLQGYYFVVDLRCCELLPEL
jgi:hypothetical protein